MNASLVTKVQAHRTLPPPAVRRAIRVAAGLSQADVGGEVGVGAYCVSRWESGERTPRGDHLVDYVRLLNDLRTS